jgi:prepilin-type N-terminal cleavage/methylation domain-containing protein
MTIIHNQRGFTLAELLVATMITSVVLGGAVMLTSQVQQSFRRQIEDSAGEQEGRYALDWVSRLIRSAGNNPYGLPLIDDNGTPADNADDFPIPPECAGLLPVGTPVGYSWIVMDPGANGENDDIRIQTDSNPPDGILGGLGAAPGGTCNQEFEDVTVSYDPDTASITFLDNNVGGAAAVRTDAVIDGLLFVFKDTNHVATDIPAKVVYVETQVRIRTRTLNPFTMLPDTRLLTQEVRLRGRNF